MLLLYFKYTFVDISPDHIIKLNTCLIVIVFIN